MRRRAMRKGGLRTNPWQSFQAYVRAHEPYGFTASFFGIVVGLEVEMRADSIIFSSPKGDAR